MAVTATQYFKMNELFEEKKLVDWCERKGVKINAHPKYPRLRILHYNNKVQLKKVPWGTFNRMCRGLVVDLELKKIVAHPFDKFFNLGETSHTLYPDLVEKLVPSVWEKMDGTMILAFWDEPSGSWIVTSKGEFENEYSQAAKKYMPKSFEGKNSFHHYTFIFELIDWQYRNVIPYDKKGYPDGLYLLGMRRRDTDHLISAIELTDLYENSPILRSFPRPKSYAFYNLDDIIDNAKALSFMDEGFVLYYQDGLMVKVKSLDYVRAHRIIWEYTDDRVLELLETGDHETLKECLISVPEEYSEDFKGTVSVAKRAKLDIVNDVYENFSKAPKDSRKEFALWVNKYVEPPLRSLMFLLMDEKPIPDGRIYQMFRQKKVDWRNYGRKQTEKVDASS